MKIGELYNILQKAIGENNKNKDFEVEFWLNDNKNETKLEFIGCSQFSVFPDMTISLKLNSSDDFKLVSKGD
jgi:hypothetical protein